MKDRCLIAHRARNGLCIDCGKPVEIRPRPKYSSLRCENCRAVYAASKLKASLCWDCENSVPSPKKGHGCEWSVNRKPVEGWEAVESVQQGEQGKTIRSFTVLKCPKFKKG